MTAEVFSLFSLGGKKQIYHRSFGNGRVQLIAKDRQTFVRNFCLEAGSTNQGLSHNAHLVATKESINLAISLMRSTAASEKVAAT